MKKIIYFFVSVLFSALFISCDNDTSLFDETASQRRNKAINEYFDILTEAGETGWLFEYFPHEVQRYGGYAFFVSFDDKLNVTSTFDKYGITDTEVKVLNTPQTSTYNVLFNFSVMLSFDTFNPYLHYFSKGIAVAAWYQGCKGDYEFMLMGHDNGVIKTKGNRNQNYLYMYKFTPTAEVPDWNAYLAAVAATDAAVPAGNGLSLIIDGEKMTDLIPVAYATGGPVNKGRCWDVVYEVQTGTNPDDDSPIIRKYQGEDVLMSYISRPEGICLYEPTTLPGYGITIEQDFVFNQDKTALIGSTSSGKTVEIKVIP